MQDDDDVVHQVILDDEMGDLYEKEAYQKGTEYIHTPGGCVEENEEPDFFELDQMDRVARKTIKEMRQTNALI